MLAYAGFKAYLPAFWSLPSLFLSGDRRRGQHRLHQLGGQPGRLHGTVRARHVEKLTGSFMGGLFFLTTCMALSSITVFWLGRSDVAGSGRGAEDGQPSAPLVKPGKVGRPKRRPEGARPYDAQGSPPRAGPLRGPAAKLKP